MTLLGSPDSDDMLAHEKYKILASQTSSSSHCTEM